MASDLVLITGVSGYIGFRTLVLALDAGYQVRAVVRKAEQISKLQQHSKIMPYVEKVQFVVVIDMAESKCFDPFLGSVTGILHVASPLAIETDDYERDIIRPSIDVTNSILQAASRAPSVKRVIITSSAVTMVPFESLSEPESTKILTEKDINANPTLPVHSPMEGYWAAKSLSRIAAHSYVETHKPHFEIIQLLPTVTIGPDELAISTSSLLVGTRALAMMPILGQKIDAPLFGAQVHVDDVAKAHIDALKPSVPGNEDYILSSDGVEGIIWDDGKELVRGMKDVERVLPLDGSLVTTKWRVDTSAFEKAFGWKGKSFEATIRDLVEQYLVLKKHEMNDE